MTKSSSSSPSPRLFAFAFLTTLVVLSHTGLVAVNAQLVGTMPAIANSWKTCGTCPTLPTGTTTITIPSAYNTYLINLFPERQSPPSQYITSTVDPFIVFNAPGSVDVTFITEGAGYRNQLGYYTFTDNGSGGITVLSRVIIWGDASMNTCIRNGHTTRIPLAAHNGGSTTFAAGTRVGFFVVADGACATNGRGDWYSHTLLNSDRLRHIAIVSNPAGSLSSVPTIAVGFEDLSLGDRDYNDIMFYFVPTAEMTVSNVAVQCTPACPAGSQCNLLTGQCTCPTGFYTADPANPCGCRTCLQTSCGEFGSCSCTTGQCTCLPGYYGPTCDSTDPWMQCSTDPTKVTMCEATSSLTTPYTAVVGLRSELDARRFTLASSGSSWPSIMPFQMGFDCYQYDCTCTRMATPPPVLGSVLREKFDGASGTSITNLFAMSNFPTTPSSTLYLTSLSSPANIGDNYGIRIRGYIHPTVTGSYTFYVSGDDGSYFWISPNANNRGDNTNKVVPTTWTCSFEGWTNQNQWNKFTSQTSAAINLVAGEQYYFELFNKEGGGGDHVSVGWKPPGQTAISVVPGTHLSPFLPNNFGMVLPCNGRGTCTPATTTTDPSCSCFEGATDSFCQTYIPCSSTSTGCNGHGTCGYNQVAKADICTCTAGWTGLTCNCDALCAADNGCSGHGTCDCGECVCNEGWDLRPDCSCSSSETYNCRPFTKGSATFDYWTNFAGQEVTNLEAHPNFPSRPERSIVLSSLETQSNIAETVGGRIYGYIIPETTGTYTFYIAADDGCRLSLSTDDNPLKKRQIAYIFNGWAGVRQWTKFPTQKSEAINLIAGRAYFFEGLYKDRGGPDNFAIGWTVPGSTTIEVVPGRVLAPINGRPATGEQCSGIGSCTCGACECPPGYTGNQCECAPCDPTTYDSVTTSCTCGVLSCKAGFGPDPRRSVPNDCSCGSCASIVCPYSSQTCTCGTCECPPGWKGEQCDRPCAACTSILTPALEERGATCVVDDEGCASIVCAAGSYSSSSTAVDCACRDDCACENGFSCRCNECVCLEPAVVDSCGVCGGDGTSCGIRPFCAAFAGCATCNAAVHASGEGCRWCASSDACVPATSCGLETGCATCAAVDCLSNHAPTCASYVLNTNEDVSITQFVTVTDAEPADVHRMIVLSRPSNGVVNTADFPGTRSFTYTPNLDFNSATTSDTFSFVVNDGQLNSSVCTVAVAVAPVNDAPVVFPNSYRGPEDAAIDGPLPANDDKDKNGPSVCGNTVYKYGDTITVKGTVRDFTTSHPDFEGRISNDRVSRVDGRRLFWDTLTRHTH